MQIDGTLNKLTTVCLKGFFILFQLLSAFSYVLLGSTIDQQSFCHDRCDNLHIVRDEKLMIVL